MGIKNTKLGLLAQQVARKLHNTGCQVLNIKATSQVAMIEIAYPSTELKRDAVEINEQVNGLRRRAYAARLGGCVVHWHEEPEQTEFERTANMSALDYLAYRIVGIPA